jgi:hypothetical protein
LIKGQLAIVVSGLNVSSYCLPAHLEILGRLGMDKAIGRKLALNYPSAPVEPKVMELFRFADKLTRSPGEMQQADVDRLREAGWSDTAIFDAVLVTSLYGANRFSAALGLVADFQLRIRLRQRENLPSQHRRAVVCRSADVGRDDDHCQSPRAKASAHREVHAVRVSSLISRIASRHPS